MAVRIVRPIFSAILSIIFMTFLGSFYHAKEQVVLVNILVWMTLIAFVYFVVFGIDYLLYLLFKKKKYPKPLVFDGFSIFASYLGILILCLALIKDPSDSLFVNVTVGLVAGACGISQFIIEIHKKANKKLTS